MKKGDTWISAVLYIALGTIVVTILLSAGLPVVNKIRDRNVALQTKEVMIGINSAVRTVMREGPGSQRSLIMDIGRGELTIDNSQETISWNMDSKVVISQIDLPVREGDLEIVSRKTNVEDKYKIELNLRYNGVADIEYNGQNKLTGRNNIIIKNSGRNGNVIRVEIRQA